jgi:hypothetical protein
MLPPSWASFAFMTFPLKGMPVKSTGEYRFKVKAGDSTCIAALLIYEADPKVQS